MVNPFSLMYRPVKMVPTLYCITVQISTWWRQPVPKHVVDSLYAVNLIYNKMLIYANLGFRHYSSSLPRITPMWYSSRLLVQGYYISYPSVQLGSIIIHPLATVYFCKIKYVLTVFDHSLNHIWCVNISGWKKYSNMLP